MSEMLDEAAADPQQVIADLKRELAECRAERDQAVAQQTATADVLGVINSSPGDLAPVFQAILEKAHSLCGADLGVLMTFDGERFSPTAAHGASARFMEATRQGFRPGPDNPFARVLAGERFVQFADLAELAAQGIDDPQLQIAVEIGIRTFLIVPLRKDDKLLGAITANRRDVRPFTDKQIALLQNFAAQAVIAMENARLMTETREALEQQTATAEVLGVINSSPGDLAPVFDAMLEKALRLCEAEIGVLWSYDGELMHPTAIRSPSAQYAKFLRQGGPRRPAGNQRPLLQGERFVQIDDLSASEGYLQGDPIPRAAVDLGGVRSLLNLALRKDDKVLGLFAIYRTEIRPFSDKQIALLQNFAAQAVIAMENARLITETREALEQQTATAEVLGVINSSPGDLTPVFDAILEKAHSLCNAPSGSLQIFDGEQFRAVATRGLSEAYVARLRRGVTARVQDPAAIAQFDFAERLAQDPGNQNARDAVEIEKLRTVLFVPLLKEGVLIGRIAAGRQEVRAFSRQEIALLQNFAAQAVIAMENARLITETREALERQTATAEILQVINSSPTDLQPVFEAIADSAARLCNALNSSVYRFDGQLIHFLAQSKFSSQAVEITRRLFPAPPSRDNATARAVADCTAVHVADVREDPEYRSREWADAIGLRSVLSVPMLREDRPIGVITVNRAEAGPFPQAQIELLKTFADQAVIAIENTRLLTETREALEQQTATAEVLGVINSSPGDLAPVFEAMLTKAMDLCGASFGVLRTYNGEVFDAVAVHGDPQIAERIRQLGPIRPATGSLFEPLVRGETVLHITDLMIADAHRADPNDRERVEAGGIRTWLAVALRKQDELLGAVIVYRQEVRPFTDKQIALLQNFAAQAVIAMENARLLGETREALEQQTATAEVLQVINASPGNLTPVFDAVLEKAHTLCGAATGSLQLDDGEFVRAVATRGLPDDFVNMLREPRRSSLRDAFLRGAPFVQVTDLADPVLTGGDKTTSAARDIAGVRTLLRVPLRNDNSLLGWIVAGRREVRPFTHKQIGLLQNFAAQAVIAIENARLLTETREALEQQTATAEVLQVINSNPGDLDPVFNAILEKAHTLCGASRGTLFLFDGETFRGAAVHGYPEQFAERLRRGVGVSQALAFAPLLGGASLYHNPDLLQAEDPMAREVAERGGVRTNLLLPLRKEATLLGVISCNRAEVKPFSEKEIALLQSFAAQAVIAIDNARLLNEIRQRQAELRVTFDNMGDGVAMFDAELRLAAWNMNFQQILGLPDAFVAERPSFADYFRYLAERGEFGDVDIEAELPRRLRAVEEEVRSEHNRPDGGIIEVRRNAVPGGGFVMIYSDVTERKRAEAEIRAARDTAEKALSELQAAQASLVHAQKMAALGQLTAGIAHEIKNPLNFVNNFAGLSVELLDELKAETAPAIAALDENTQAEIDETMGMLTSNLEKIAEHGRRADGIVKSMLEHSRGTSGDWRAVDLNALVEEALNLAYHGARAQDQTFNITMERDLDQELAPVEVVPQDLTRVFLNLITNGFYAATKRTCEAADGFRPVLKVTTRDLGERVEIQVRDNGIGIAPEIRDKLFQPFFTTKPTGEGTGLGLSISYDIITQEHGGTIAVESEPGSFTEFTIRLPRRGSGSGLDGAA